MTANESSPSVSLPAAAQSDEAALAAEGSAVFVEDMDLKALAAAPEVDPAAAALQVRRAELDRREAALSESEKLALELEAEARTTKEQALAQLASAKTKTTELDQRERQFGLREQNVERRDTQLSTLKTSLDQRETAVELREQKAKQRLSELEQKDEKRKEAERELKRRDAELEKRERAVKERELEAEAGFAAQNRAALAALEKEHGVLRGQLVALRQEVQEARASGFAVVDADLVRERNQRAATLDNELNERRAHGEEQLAAELTRETKRVLADHAQRTKAVAAQEEKLQLEQTLWRAEVTRTREQQQAASEKSQVLSDARDRDIQLRMHKLQIGEAELQADAAQIEEQAERRSQARVAELTTRLAEREQRSEELLAQVIRVEKRLESFAELQRRFADQSPEEVLSEREQLRQDRDRLRAELDARPTAEDKQRLEQLSGERDKLEKELTDARRRLASLTADRTKWALSVADLEHERSLKEAEERRRQALEAQNEKLADEVARVRKLYEAPQDKTKRIESIEKAWDEKLVRAAVEPELTEVAWLDRIIADCHESGLDFPRRLVLAFHTVLKTADWSPIAVLAGVSGTGKSELPRLYSRFGGLAFMPRPVQPNWDSPQSLFGFFNSIDNRFDATPLLQALVQSQQSAEDPDHPHGFSDRLLLILLDEMNLAHVEQYFSDLLSKLEERRGVKEGVCVDIELGGGLKYPVPMGRNVLWVGTMNEDETTKSLSDKVIDRSNLIYFPRPQKLHRRRDAQLLDPRPLLPRKSWEKWITNRSPFTEEDIAIYIDALERMNGALENVGRALGHRVWQATEHYMANHPDVMDAVRRKDPEAKKKGMQRAFEDQLVQKAMPKLRGIETAGAARSKCLEPIGQLIKELDLHLADDYAIALRVGAGAFVWNSARYIESDK